MNFKARPSARIKRIYLLIDGGSRSEIEKIILDYLGVLGWAKASPIFVEGGKKEGRIIIALERREVNNIRAAFEAFSGNLKIIRASGTIKGLS